MLISPGILPYIYHVGSNFNLYSIISNGLILGGQNVRAERLKGGEPLYNRQYLSPQSPKTNRDCSGRPVAQEIVDVLQEEPSSSDRTGKLVSREEQHVQNHDSSGKPEREEAQHTVQENYHLKSRDKVDKFDFATDDTNIDFSVSGISDEAVKRSENFRSSSTDSENHTSPTKNKLSRTISTKNNRSMNSALSRNKRSRNQATLRFPRSSIRSRSGNASLALNIAIQDSYTVYVDV